MATPGPTAGRLIAELIEEIVMLAEAMVSGRLCRGRHGAAMVFHIR